MKNIAIAMLLGAFVAAPAVADDMYVGLKLGSTKNEVQQVSNTSSIYGIYGGYRIIQNVAVEAGYTDLGSMASGAVKISSVELSGVGSIPINEQFSLYVKLGLAQTAEKAPGLTVNRSTATIGLGGLYNATPTIDARFGVDVYGFGDEKTALREGASVLLSASAIYKF